MIPTALVLAAAVAAPAAARSSDAAPALSVGALAGYERGDHHGPSLRIDVDVPLDRLSSRASLSGVGSLGGSYLSMDVPYGTETVTYLKAIPAARVTLRVNRLVAMTADAGLGLFYGRLSREQTVAGFSPFTVHDTTVGAVARLALGASYRVGERLRMGGEADLARYTSASETTWSILASVAWTP